MPYVNQAPNALWLSRRKPDRVTRLVQVPAHSIDPAETEGLVQCFRISDTDLSRRLLVKAHQQFARAVVVLLEPLSKLGRYGEKLWFHRVGACPGRQTGRKVELASHRIGFTRELMDRVMNGKSILSTSSLGRW